MTARTFGQIAGSLVGILDPNREREHIWRHSYDVDTPEGKPWLRVLDGARDTWTVAKNALCRTCREDINEQAKQAADARRNGGKVDRHRLRVGDDRILEAYLDDYNPDTGELFTAQKTIADELGLLSASPINAAVARLRRHGYLDWVRRSRVTEEEGQPGWKRKQASNGYFFDWKKRMPARTWSRFWQLVLAGLKKAGKDAIAKTAALFTRVVAPRLLGRPRRSPSPGPRLRTTLKRDSSARIYPGPEI